MFLFKLIHLLFENPLIFIIFFVALTVPLLISITVDEWAHGFVAYKFGDSTPKEQGRLSLNPLKHLDPLGTLMLFIVGIGWAKPVEINPYNINNRFKLMLVAFAGPFSSFMLAAIFSVMTSFIIYFSGLKGEINPETNILAILVVLLGIIVRTNLILGMFNLIPLPPLDGANIIRNLLPQKLADAYFGLAPYGMPILLILIFMGGIKYIFNLADYFQIQLLSWTEYIFHKIVLMF